MAKPILIGCVGAGGTGKTTVVNSLAESNKHITVVPSVIRPTMKSLGYQTEDEMRAESPQRRLEIQTLLLEAYVANLQKVINNATTDILLFERTAIDHYGYCLVHGGAALTVGAEQTLVDWVNVAMGKFDALVYFPYPTPFVNQSADGFRTTDGAVGQNFILDNIYQAQIGKIKPGVPLLKLDVFDVPNRLKGMNMLIDHLNPHI